jgi:hypothetical protein
VEDDGATITVYWISLNIGIMPSRSQRLKKVARQIKTGYCLKKPLKVLYLATLGIIVVQCGTKNKEIPFPAAAAVCGFAGSSVARPI